MTAANYYAAYFDEFKNVMNELNLEDASSIRICKYLLESHETRNNLAFINAHYGSLLELICKLEGRNVPLYEAISLYENISDLIDKVPGDKGSKVL